MHDKRHPETSIEQSGSESHSAPIRQRNGAFWFGLAATTVVAALHFPMYFASRNLGYHMAGMPMDSAMVAAMVPIVMIALVALAVATPPISTTALIRALPMTIAATSGFAFLAETRRRSPEDTTAEELRVAA